MPKSAQKIMPNNSQSDSHTIASQSRVFQRLQGEAVSQRAAKQRIEAERTMFPHG
jgi:hypothetical protein